MLSDTLNEYGNNLTDSVLEILAYSCLSPHHAGQFKAFIKQINNRYQLSSIMEGGEKEVMNQNQKNLAHRAKALLKELSSISLEMAQMVVSKQGEDDGLPGWFMVDIIRDLPRLVERKES